VDPIELAGGLNAYGFAGGDPVNYSDPFGLCHANDEQCLAMVASYSAAGATTGFYLGGGTGVLETVSTLGVAAPVAVAQTAVATAAGAVIGAAVGNIVSFAISSTSGNSSAAQRGQKAHSKFSEEMRGKGYETNKQIPGSKLRPDAMSEELGEVHELKPNNAEAIAKGIAQLTKYVKAAAQAWGKEVVGTET
jgi:gas vesicle protein